MKEGVEQKKSNEILRKNDALDETDFVDPVNGPHDIVAMIEVPATVNTVVETIQAIDGVAKVQTCRILGIHKEW